MEKNRENNHEEISQDREPQQAIEISEDKLLSQMAKEEEGEHNTEGLTDDMTHDLRTSKTRRG